MELDITLVKRTYTCGPLVARKFTILWSCPETILERDPGGRNLVSEGDDYEMGLSIGQTSS